MEEFIYAVILAAPLVWIAHKWASAIDNQHDHEHEEKP